MNKRIFRSMVSVVLFMAFVFLLVWGSIFSVQFGNQIKGGLKTLRVTIIDKTGVVTFDNASDPSVLDNHMYRPEVIEALKNGVGESERFSTTLGETTYYYAERLSEGSVLRLSLTTNSIYTNFSRFIPIAASCLLAAALLAFLVAKKLTKRITQPINAIDLDAPEIDAYDELLPFIKKIEVQKKEISAQLFALKNQTNTIRTITDNMQEGLLLLDEKGTVLLANRSILRILDGGDALHKNVIELCRDISVLESIDYCLAGGNTETTLSRGGRIFSVFCNPVHSGTAQGGAVILFVDATEQHFAEAQRKEFSANVSHELKTPLTTISALSEMIADGTAKEKDVRDFAAKIGRQSRRLIHIVEDIIKLSEFDEGGLERGYSGFNLYELAASVLAGLEEKAREKNVKMELQGDENLCMTANRRMMDELLYNLIDNAVSYNKEGGQVKVSLMEEGDAWRITVADTGIGIPKEHIGRIFERFYRVEKSRSKKTGGTGLGLSIVKHVVEFHEGQIEVASEENVGTSISCRIKKRPDLLAGTGENG